MEKEFTHVLNNEKNQSKDTNNDHRNQDEKRRECVICGDKAMILDDENHWLCSDCANFYQD